VSITPFKPKAAADASSRVAALVAAASGIVLGKTEVLRLAVTCLLAGGHLLLEDLPGVGKTTLAQALARLLGLSYQRLQCTSDLMPADVVGVLVYDRNDSQFRFHPGPVFTQVLLADEINRATPRAQSALLEAMEERQVTVDGRALPLPTPFFVIATQNPSDQVGTYPLPESQLDRFLMRLSLGYPDRDAERELLQGRDRRVLLADLGPVFGADELLDLQRQVDSVHVADALVDYLQALLARSRELPGLAHGLSPRAGLALLRAARAWALVHGRGHVLPEDVKAVLPSVAAHRLAAREVGVRAEAIVPQLLRTVPVG
jgi:MoxR-like ATPase